MQSRSTPAGHCRWAATCEVVLRSHQRRLSQHLLCDAPNAGQRWRRRALDSAAMLFAQYRGCIRQAIVDSDDASSEFSDLWRCAVVNAASASTANGSRWWLARQRTRMRFLVGCTYRPLAVL